jgi:hypothetical protein
MDTMTLVTLCRILLQEWNRLCREHRQLQTVGLAVEAKRIRDELDFWTEQLPPSPEIYLYGDARYDV